MSSISAGPFTAFRWVRPLSPPLPPHVENTLGDQFSDMALSTTADFLFHHYLTRIAPTMMPFRGRCNPWKSSYPLMARSEKSCGQRALLHGLLSQAAGNLAHIGYQRDEMATLTLKHYVSAIAELRKALRECSDFCIIIASILTLIMAEASHVNYITDHMP
jgi:Fungal specific transcription factor domain